MLQLMVSAVTTTQYNLSLLSRACWELGWISSQLVPEHTDNTDRECCNAQKKHCQRDTFTGIKKDNDKRHSSERYYGPRSGLSTKPSSHYE